MSLKETKMPEGYTILTPLPQLILKKPIQTKVTDTLRKEGFCFSPMTPLLYQYFENITKNNQCSNEIKSLLEDTLKNSGVIFWAKIPTPMPIPKLPLVNGIAYSCVADEILRRLFNCLLLFDFGTPSIPKPFRRSLWFFANGAPEQIDTDTLALLEPQWNYYDWEIKYAEPAPAELIITYLSISWDKLSSVAKIDLLNEIFINEKKKEFYKKSAEENRLMSELKEIEANFDRTTKISNQQRIEWLIQGWQSAYFKEIDKLTSKLKDVSEQRFIRAFQFFTDACRMSNPHKFVALTMPLETLFSTTTREITFQLSSRIAWFLEPDDFDKRDKLFNNVQDLYDTRSKIVHGAKYDAIKVDKTVWNLEDLDRRVFSKILSCDPIHKMIFDKNQKSWEQYLDGLNLGISRNGGKD